MFDSCYKCRLIFISHHCCTLCISIGYYSSWCDRMRHFLNIDNKTCYVHRRWRITIELARTVEAYRPSGSQCERYLRLTHLPCQFYHLRFPRSIQQDPRKIALHSALSEWETDHQHEHQIPHKFLIVTDSHQIIRSCLV